MGRPAGIRPHRQALRAADRVIVNKRRDLEGYSGWAGLKPKLSMLAPGISTDEFHPDPGLHLEHRRRLGLGEQTVVMLAASRLTYRGRGRKVESLRFLLDCFADADIQRRNVALLIAGDGKAQAELDERARGLGTRVQFLGPVPHQQMRAVYNASDLFVFPGLREPIGMVYLPLSAGRRPKAARAARRGWGRSHRRTPRPG